MTMRRIAAVAGWAMLGVAATAAPVPHRAGSPRAVATRDWGATAARLPSGAMLRGNPQAKVRLVEYYSFTCPHCALFSAEAEAPLAAYIRSGRVSYEARPAVRDGFDLAAQMVARCGGPAAFFRLMPILFATQGEWLGKGADWAGSAPDMSKLPPAELPGRFAHGAGLDALAAAHGVPAARLNACMADQHEQQLLADAAKAIWTKPGFEGTPGFLINDATQTETLSWATLKPKLDAALR